MQDKFPHFTKHTVSIIPYDKESKDFTIHFQKLPQFVKVTWSFVCSQSRFGFSVFNVRI